MLLPSRGAAAAVRAGGGRCGGNAAIGAIVRGEVEHAAARQRIEQTGDLPPVPPQQLPWLVALFPKSDKLKGVIAASEKIKQEEAEQTMQVAQQPSETEFK